MVAVHITVEALIGDRSGQLSLYSSLVILRDYSKASSMVIRFCPKGLTRPQKRTDQKARLYFDPIISCKLNVLWY